MVNSKNWNHPHPHPPPSPGLAGDHRIHAVSQISAASSGIDQTLQLDELGALEVEEDFAQEVLGQAGTNKNRE